MKKLTSLIAAWMLATSVFASHDYVQSSVLSSGTFVKIRVAESGLYAITYDELRSMGLDPATVRLYGYGGAMLPQDFEQPKTDDLPLVPVLLDKGADNIFNSGDRLIFYAQGPISWSYNGERFAHTRNPYSDYGYYFLTSGQGATAEIAAPEAAENTAYTSVVSTYIDYRLHEKELVNLIDRSGVEGGGREFYGEQFRPDTTRHFRFIFSGLSAEEVSCGWYIDLAASSSTTSSFLISMDNASATANASAISVTDNYTKATTTQSYKQFTPSANGEKDISITYRCSGSSSALGYLNYIELSATCTLTLSGNQPLCFRTTQGIGTNDKLLFRIAGATAETQVWDVTDPAAAQRINTNYDATSGTVAFTANNSTVREYIAFNPSTATCLSPVKVGETANQNLHALTGIELIIIAPEELLSEAERLAEAHRQYDGMTAAVVTDEQIYNEFSSGTPDATAYRWLMKMLYDRANRSGGTISAPRYLCLFGDGSFDNRKLLLNSGNHCLLTYQACNSVSEVKAYATDDYFGFLDDNEGTSDISGRMDIGVGRLPISTLSEAAGTVDKLIRQISGGNKGKWKSQLIFLADDGDSNLHTRCADQAGETVRTSNPDFITNKIYLDAYTQEVSATGESYPLAESRLNNLLQSGALLFDYCGHSGYNNASSEGLISSAGIRAMRNDNPAFWIFASCSFALFDAGKTSAAEEAVLNQDGGALAVCAACRTVYADQNATLNRHICNALFDHATPLGYHNRIGDAVRLGKNACGSEENKLAYVLLGDPALSLHFPTDCEVITTAVPDTLRALDVATIGGYLRTADGDTASWFNGRLSITVYDKMQQVTTLDNDQSEEELKVRFTYNDYPNILYRGETAVRDGRFSCTFMVPKDIRYNYGTGRIVYYALDSIGGEEGIGHTEDFIIGGSSTRQLTDTLGPEIDLYLGSTAFVSGDKTNETPHFFARISDENGINTAGSGIGHDLLLIVDGKTTETYVLNDYFSASGNSYQQGLVSYRMAELTEGPHSLMFRAWDLLNNSSSATVDFQVVKGLDPGIVSVVAYPNPAASGEEITIAFEYDQPDVVMQTDIMIYDLAGRLVGSLSQRGAEALRWNTASSPAPAGIYLYRVVLSSSTTKTCSRAGKLIIR